MRPEEKDAKIKAFKRLPMRDLLIDEVTLLSTGEKLSFEKNEEEMVIKAVQGFKSDMPICFKIKLS